MNANQAIREMANGNRDGEALSALAAAVARASNRGEWYDGPGSTHIEEWLAEGDFTGNETVESLAAEWDE